MHDNQQRTELWLVRHGQTDWNLQGRYQGQSDIPLNETGLTQAQVLAAELQAGQAAGRHFAAVYSSDLMRARRTAEILAAALGLPLQIDARLREISLGQWEGKNIQAINVQYHDQLARREEDVPQSRAPGGESAFEVAGRVSAAADDIAAAYPGDTVLVVFHGVAMACLISLANGQSLQNVYGISPRNTHPIQVQWPVPVRSAAMGDDGR